MMRRAIIPHFHHFPPQSPPCVIDNNASTLLSYFFQPRVDLVGIGELTRRFFFTPEFKVRRESSEPWGQYEKPEMNSHSIFQNVASLSLHHYL